MQIALLGGTGDIGGGLALRWARDTDHEVIVGSRDVDRAKSAAADYEVAVATQGQDVTIRGMANEAAAGAGDVVVLAVPSYHLTETIKSVAGALDADDILVSPAVGMQRDEAGFHYNPPAAGSVTALAARAAPEDVAVVGGFHNLPAGRLGDLDATLSWDTVVVGDDPDARQTVMGLGNAIEGLRTLDGGPLANAAEFESMTAVLINVARHNAGMQDLGITFE
jgi:NADPH-dependent F420 reductase